MSLSSDPSVTYNAQGNLRAMSASLAASGTATVSPVDFSSNSLGGWLQITPTGGSSVATTNGCQVGIYPAGDSTPHYDYYPMIQQVITIVASTATPLSFLVPTGKYALLLTNLDATNAITVGVTANPIA